MKMYWIKTTRAHNFNVFINISSCSQQQFKAVIPAILGGNKNSFD